jgi:hypothetical protein
MGLQDGLNALNGELAVRVWTWGVRYSATTTVGLLLCNDSTSHMQQILTLHTVFHSLACIFASSDWHAPRVANSTVRGVVDAHSMHAVSSVQDSVRQRAYMRERSKG